MSAIESGSYTSPRYGRDNQGRYRTWPLTNGPVDPEENLPSWAHPVSAEPFERLVEPAPLQDPMVEVTP